MVNAACALERLNIQQFGTDGIRISGCGPTTYVNFWQTNRVRASSNGGHGLYVEGDNANVGVCTLLDPQSNVCWGIYDHSLVGNTYISCHISANTTGAYQADYSAAVHLFL